MIKTRLYGHHPQRKLGAGGGAEAGKAGQTSARAVVWEESAVSHRGAARACTEGLGLRGVAEEWSSGLRSPMSGLVMMKAKISPKGSQLDY